MHSDYRRTPADTGGHEVFEAMSAINCSQFQTVTHRRTPADTGFGKVHIKNPRVRNFPEIDVRRRPPSAVTPIVEPLQVVENKKGAFRVWVTPPPPGGTETLEHVGDTLARLAAEDPEQWAWLLNGRAEQKEAP